MIVGKAIIKKEELLRHVGSTKAFVSFSDSLIPEEFRSNVNIRNNQRYLCCMYLRKVDEVSWNKKKEIINEILSSVKIIGYLNMLVEVNKLYTYVNVNKVNEYLSEMRS